MKQIEQFDLPMPMAKPVEKDPREGWTSASNATADKFCEGRHQAQAGLPELPCTPDEAEARESGVNIHHALATRNPAALTENELQTYERCLEIEERAVKQFFGDEANDELLTIAEERYWVSFWKDPNDTAQGKLKHSAQADRIYRSKTKALILEYKTLQGDYAVASSNEQLRDQVCLVSGSLVVPNVGGVVVQPLVTMTPEICLYDADQIRTATALMFDRVRASHKLGAKRTAGDVQCTFCRAKLRCLEYEQWSASQLPVMQSFVDSPIETWTPHQCGVFIERCGTAQKWLDTAREQVYRRVQAGELPGWQIGEGDRKFEITNIAELNHRCAALGIPSDVLLSISKPNKEALTKLVRKVTGTKGKALQEKLDELLKDICADERKRGSIERVQPKQTNEGNK